MASDPGTLLIEVAERGDVASVMAAVNSTLRAWVGVGPVFLATADPVTRSFTGTFDFDVPLDAAAAFYAIEMAGGDVVPFARLATSATPVESLYGATHGEPATSERWRQVISPLGWGDELRAAISCHGSTWGYLCLHREGHERAFTPSDLARATALLPCIATAMRLATLSGLSETDRLAPGVVLVDERGQLSGVTGAAAAWLDELGPCLRSGLPLLISGLAQLALDRREAISTTVTTRTGRCGVIDAALLQHADRSQVAVVISAAPISYRLERFAAASGLTPREQEVVSCVVAGLSTRAISDRLSISPYTVQAHLTSVYTKTGTRSRRRLLARISG